MDVGFVGLGRMGGAMARNVARAGHHVRAWNRSAITRETAEGIGIVASPADAFAADVVLTMLSDDAAIREVVLSSRALEAARAGCVHVVTSTISVAFSDELRARHEALGLAYVAAPVFGRPEAAQAAQLNIVAAGAPAAVEKARPVLDLIGRQVWVLGEEPKLANAAKIAGNMMIAMAIEAMAEAAVITSTHGLAPDRFFNLMTQTLFGGRAYEIYGRKIADGDDEPGFTMTLGLKDLRLAGEAAAPSGKQLTMLAAVRAQMSAAIEAGMGGKDWSGIAGYTMGSAGKAARPSKILP